MKINNRKSPEAADVSSSREVGLSKSAKSKKSQSGDGVVGSSHLSSAKINLSDRAQDIQKAKDVIGKTPDVDEAKVARFQKLIDSGEYATDASAIADRLVDDHLKYS